MEQSFIPIKLTDVLVLMERNAHPVGVYSTEDAWFESRTERAGRTVNCALAKASSFPVRVSYGAMDVKSDKPRHLERMNRFMRKTYDGLEISHYQEKRPWDTRSNQWTHGLEFNMYKDETSSSDSLSSESSSSDSDSDSSSEDELPAKKRKTTM